MIKKLFFILTILFVFSNLAISQDQEIRPIKFKKLKKEIRKQRSPFYYPVLFQRYLDLDTSLTYEEFRHLYYGFTFQDAYSPYGIPALQDSLISYLSRQELLRAEYQVAARIGGQLLRESPFRLRETFITAVAYEMAGDGKMSSIYFNFFEKQVDAIMSSGDGLSTNTAFVVIYIRDEYEMLEVLGFKFGGGQALLAGDYDKLELEENPYGVEALYFDVSRLFAVGFK
ncbi:MAG: DUF4919 domain-containing protein [Bacteroidetes bacterium]|nr:DUF4919 domain-containing protein [Bacteroidota bacterium]MCK5765790.1 DUF4919 domain-containing protein [Bacteroidales bacterium]